MSSDPTITEDVNTRIQRSLTLLVVGVELRETREKMASQLWIR